jgi:hypothetical protein
VSPPDLAPLLPAGLSPALTNAVVAAWSDAPFLKGLIRGRQATLATLAAAGPDAALADALALAADDAQPIMPRLRIARKGKGLGQSGEERQERACGALDEQRGGKGLGGHGNLRGQGDLFCSMRKYAVPCPSPVKMLQCSIARSA